MKRTANVYKVGQVNAYIKNLFAMDYALRSIVVKGEVSNCKYHSSGHIYFTLKDETGTLSAVMFAGQRAGLRFRLEEGQKVLVSGSIMVYERDGKYQLYAREITLDGIGDLYARFEELKQRLGEMGMFAPEYKQPIPRFVKRVGIVTSPTGAAIRDIVNIAGRRNPYVQLILYPALVQGEQAVRSIVRGIETLDSMGLDCLIVGRGGGSIEDLWAFNEEPVARAIFDCQTPVISAVGHETDTTIADFVADLRAPTPSAAAELAVYDVYEYMEQLEQRRLSLRRLMNGKIGEQKLRLTAEERRLERLHPQYQLGQRSQQLANARRLLDDLIRRRLESCRQQLAVAAARLSGVSPLTKLEQGYAYVTGECGENIKSVEQAPPGSRITVRLADGKLESVVKERISDGRE
ncbi:exodeoxyribonuclease VII large subunit [Hominifimenecus sp. rT4P-3]|uniref:exodeoxyribonuclease VII large subunit n=1 Tax=Hominifimenecus sp. rT4P-3 TaxID=3242979 RepID=UPI003DA58147